MLAELPILPFRKRFPIRGFKNGAKKEISHKCQRAASTRGSKLAHRIFDRVSPKGFLFDVRILQDARCRFHHSQQQIVQVVLSVLDSLLLQFHHALHVDYQLD